VVSNAGPLLVLAKLNVLHLLKRLYGRIYIPQAVYEETVVVGLRRGYEDAHILKLFLDQVNWLPTPMSLPPTIAALKLDQGEQESLALAVSLKALLLMDEELGRMEARQRGLTVRGSLGVLVTAYDQGIVAADQLRLYFEQITSRNDIWISPALCRRVLFKVLASDEGR
jgi:predicted nucleic acid-binding protein